jgi:hypothetical protein
VRISFGGNHAGFVVKPELEERTRRRRARITAIEARRKMP